MEGSISACCWDLGRCRQQLQLPEYHHWHGKIRSDERPRIQARARQSPKRAAQASFPQPEIKTRDEEIRAE